MARRGKHNYIFEHGLKKGLEANENNYVEDCTCTCVCTHIWNRRREVVYFSVKEEREKVTIEAYKRRGSIQQKDFLLGGGGGGKTVQLYPSRLPPML